MRNVLITGASGFTGGALLHRLAHEKNLQTSTVSRSSLENPASLRSIFRDTKPAWIFHLAGALKGTASEIFQANVQITIHLLEAAAEIAPSARVLLIGSAAEYGIPINDQPISEEHPCRPVGPYGISKYAMTLAGLDFSKRAKLQVNIARAFNLIGPGIPSTLLLGAVIERLQTAIQAGKDFISVGDVSAERDFLDVRDAAEAYVDIMNSDANGEVFNVCSGVGTCIFELVEAALKFTGKPIRYEIDPKLGSGGAPIVIGSPLKLQRIGYCPRFSIEESIADTCAPLRSK